MPPQASTVPVSAEPALRTVTRGKRGANFDLDMKAAVDMHKVGEQETHKQKVNFRIKGRESPPKLHQG